MGLSNYYLSVPLSVISLMRHLKRPLQIDISVFWLLE